MEKAYREFADSIINGMVDWVRVVDRQNRIVFMNKSMKDAVGDYVGRECYSVLGLDHPCPNCITEHTLKTGQVHSKEERVGDRVFSVASSPVRDASGNIYCAVEVFRDVTKEKELENRIIEQNKLLNKSLYVAKKLQERLLPPQGVVNECLKVSYSYIPSEMLGGDFFDVFPINRWNTGVYIADIAGHGIMSSMITVFIRQTVRALGEEALSPSRVLRDLLHRFSQLALEQSNYFTIFYGVYDCNGRNFKYSNAGHNPPILYKGREIQFLEGSGLPICTLAEGYEYPETHVKADTGDALYLYTDGITEARNLSGNFLGTEGLISLVRESNNVDRIINRVEKFCSGRFRDDIALLKVQVL